MESEFPLYINTITTKFLTVVLKELRLQHIHYWIQVRDEHLCSKGPHFQKKNNEIGISFYMLILNNVFKMPIKNPCCCLRGEFFMFHLVKIPRKIKKSGFPDYILIYILLSKCLQSFTIRFIQWVKREMFLPTQW